MNENNTEIEITEENINDYAKILNEIVDELAKESEESIPMILDDIANYYNIPVKVIIKSLRSVNSIYTLNNPIVYYFNGDAIRRTNAQSANKFLLIKLGTKMRELYSDLENGSEIFLKNMRMILDESL